MPEDYQLRFIKDGSVLPKEKLQESLATHLAIGYISRRCIELVVTTEYKTESLKDHPSKQKASKAAEAESNRMHWAPEIHAHLQYAARAG